MILENCPCSLKFLDLYKEVSFWMVIFEEIKSKLNIKIDQYQRQYNCHVAEVPLTDIRRYTTGYTFFLSKIKYISVPLK